MRPAAFRLPSIPRPFFVLTLVAAPSWSQGPAFSSPGQPRLSTSGQTNQFTNDFNPAIGVVIDVTGELVDPERGNAGADFNLRLLELNLSANIDPDAWAYVVFTSEDGESPNLEEAAVEYTGLPGNQTLKLGQFFVDFGKQMQHHLEELRTRDRPLPLREFLGEELAGVGVQYDNWFALSDTTPLRFSIGAYSSLLGESHGHEEAGPPEPTAHVPERKDIDELSFAGRVTLMTEVGDSVLQLGTSARYVPEFAFEEDTVPLRVDGLSNFVYGADVTLAMTDETGLESTTLGGEVLVFDGDLAGSFDVPTAPTAIRVVDDTAMGFFLFGDFGLDERDSLGFQFAMADLPEQPNKDARELDLYFTRNLTEVRRLRVGVTLGQSAGLDENALYVQFTNYFGNHAHGLNW